jgi:predicted  nucleic acid-binding Zn-ribbon protein
VEDLGSSNKYDLETRLHDALRELEIEKETTRREVVRARQEAEGGVVELKSMFIRENQTLRQQLKEQRDKLSAETLRHKQDSEISAFKQDNEVLRERTEELETALEEYRRLLDERADSVASLQKRLGEEDRSKSKQIERMREQIESLKVELRSKLRPSSKTHHNENRPLQLPSTDRSARSQRAWETSDTFNLDRLGEEMGQRRREVEQKDRQTRDLKIELETVCIQKERLEMEVERLKTELQTIKKDWMHTEERRMQTEAALKSEIKFLIGKLLKAKNKIVAESGELSETLRKEATIDMTRCKSVNRSRTNVSRVSTQRPISPLNLSAISRAESPFLTYDMELGRFD